MPEPTTATQESPRSVLLRLDPPSGGGRGTPSLPSDLMEQVRGRVRILVLFFAFAFGFDVVFALVRWMGANLGWFAVAEGRAVRPAFLIINFVAVLASLALHQAAGRRDVSSQRLHLVGLVYQVVICFISAATSFWQSYLDIGSVPNLTWVPAVIIMFPLILPGPPRRTLVASIAAGVTPVLALLLLEGSGKIHTDGGAYAPAIVGSAFAVFVASMGSRVVYGLGREVAEAREMGSYRLEEKLGEGGMGEVWRARHRLLARPAAIKLIRPAINGRPGEQATDEAVRRFEREAQAIAMLRSPHTVDIYDFGVTREGSFYYVMELLEGIDTDSLVRRFGPIPAERAIHLVRQACHSLSEAEFHGLVHRDVKPANVFLCRYGEEVDFVKVLDFGLVKGLADGAESPKELTSEHMIRGTPAFMAPEQALGRRDLDARVDIYALGCVAYWLLTGELVFEGSTQMETLLHHAHTPPRPPSARTEMPIPLELDRIIVSCLEKDPERRPRTARDLAHGLEAIEGLPPWTEDRARAWWARHVRL